MKGGGILAGLIALVVGAFVALILAGVLLIPFSGLAQQVPPNGLLWGLRLIIFAVVFTLVFREMKEKFAR